jgi:hypothetical protein
MSDIAGLNFKPISDIAEFREETGTTGTGQSEQVINGTKHFQWQIPLQLDKIENYIFC